jgi:hypothetical protein
MRRPKNAANLQRTDKKKGRERPFFMQYALVILLAANDPAPITAA